METRRDRVATVAIVTGVITLLLGLCLGAMLGGMGGFLIGRGAATQSISRSQPVLPAPRSEIPAPFRTPRSLVPPNATPEPALPPNTGGVVVEAVVAGSPAEAAGIQSGDIITRIDNTPLDANHALADLVAQHAPGDRIAVTVWRAGETLTLEVELGARVDDSQAAYLGVRYTEVNP